MHSLQIVQTPLHALRKRERNARTHSKKQIRQIAASIQRFGFNNAILTDDNLEIIAGHGRFEAAKLLGLTTVPTVCLSHLNEADRRAYVLADNQLATKAGWDKEILALELQGLIDLGFEVELTGFETAEIDIILDIQNEAAGSVVEPEDQQVEPGVFAVSRPGDIWVLGRHSVLCGDARSPASYASLLGDEKADLVFTDPPYNVPIDGNVCGLGQIKHREFTMASGEMSETAFTEFLRSALGEAKRVSRDGALHYVFMDWRHLHELFTAGRQVYDDIVNLCVWNKSNAGMGSFYRSKHELVLIFKVGEAAHTNTIELGKHGRNRSNVWDYAGVNCFGSNRLDELAMHPTVKPVALIADALKDASKRSEIVLDPFCGSGSTIIAAEKVGRRARAIEIDPAFVDVIVRRWQTYSGKRAVLQKDGFSFEEAEECRRASASQHQNCEVAA
ncbi:site-specific DNA-methyltransferase [Pseudorhodoplanes sinuspersici]|uniref:site-specific DNA-methyltransferase (adenine-specific) n=1 Tax=Pseudorhodoplanes sinuspersici TaxID=1235591 RepID=A0A1W6ZY58_9HYPH|nr:DNA methyltransferase [Pseudorhodoplanes sinuspersici]ARQ02347.1 DNA methylase N-4 [Pseudorhodoplanes sinuspersici]RKE74174.1 DNA modification methylase [Pseudorhodoplanes sinuspersici]